jgi:hypothetical protein
VTDLTNDKISNDARLEDLEVRLLDAARDVRLGSKAA